jgi:hypothetical protein
MKLIKATRKLKKYFLTTRYVRCVPHGDTAHIDTIFKFLPHTRQHGCIDILHCCKMMRVFVSARSRGLLRRRGPLRTFHEIHVAQ